MSALTVALTEDELTRQVTDRAKNEVARDFATWIRCGEIDQWTTRTAKCYATEVALAGFVARTALALGDYVARGALIDFASGLSDYLELDTFKVECVAALRKREGNR